MDALLGKAQVALTHEHLPEAIALYQQATNLQPASSEARHGSIQAQRRSGNPAAAEAGARDCLDRLPQDSECREQYASLRLDAGDYVQAAAHFQLLLRNGIASKQILDNLAFSLMRTGDNAQAVELFESSLKRYGEDGWIYTNLGYLYRSRGDLAAAGLNYRRALQLSPLDPEFNYNLGLVLYLSKDYSSALDRFLTAVRLRPGWGQAHFYLAMIYWNLGRYAMALSQAQLAQDAGMKEAAPIVRTLAESLSLTPPRLVVVRRLRR